MPECLVIQPQFCWHVEMDHFVGISFRARAARGHRSNYLRFSHTLPDPCPCSASLRATVYDLHDTPVPYEKAWRWQKKLVELEASSSDNNDAHAGSVLLLQHLPTYTLGTASTEDNLKFDPKEPPLPLFRTERGGEVTYHGPGQLVMYPILNLRRFRTDLHWFLRSLEEVIIRALNEVSGLQGEREDGLTGVWVDGKKVAAIGVRATRWISYHGLALNVTTDLMPFENIVPCGIADRHVGSVAGFLGDDEGGGDHSLTNRAMDGAMDDRLRWEQQLLVEYRYGLLAAVAEVFDVELVVVEGEDAEKALKLL